MAADVGSPDVSDEQRVTGENHPRLFRSGTIRHEQRDALRSMTRCVQRLDDDVAERHAGAIVERRERIVDVRASVEVDRRISEGGQRAFARPMVGVDMGREYRLDSHVILVGEFYVLSDLELRIDDRGAALAASTEEVRRAAGFGAEKLTEDHDGAPIGKRVNVLRCVSLMRTPTIVPEANVSAATTVMAAFWPSACAMSPEMSAPNA